MNQREKRLALALGLLALLVAAFAAFNYLSAGWRSRQTRIAALEKEISEKELQIAQGMRASERILNYEGRSLPPDRELARGRYQSWLLELAEQAGFENRDVRLQSLTPGGDVFDRFKFFVSSEGNINELTRFLHDFYSSNQLHRIQRLTVKPIGGTKQLAVTVWIEALSLPGSANAKDLSSELSHRLAFGSLEDYQGAITGRNIFGLPNLPPRMASVLTQSGYVNQPFSYTFAASDDNKLDQVTFALEDDALPGARLDPRSGRLSWTPRAEGEYSARVRVYDDGLPSKFDEQTLRIDVGPAAEDQPPDFDVAQYTVLTSILDVNGTPQVWLLERTSGRKLELRIGDSFEVGTVKGVVREINLKNMEYETDGKRVQLSIGKKLTEGREIVSDSVTRGSKTNPVAGS